MKVEKIIIHHSATKDGTENDWEAIRRYHTSYRIDGVIVTKASFLARKALADGKHFEEPWKDIGYHYGIEEEKGMVQVRTGRPETEHGAHCNNLGMNSKSIGICVVGNYDAEKPMEEKMVVLFHLVVDLLLKYGLSYNDVLGHHEVQELAGVPPDQRKTCPGKLFDMNELRKELLKAFLDAE